MLFFGGLLGLVMAGLMVDLTSLSSSRDEDPEDEANPETLDERDGEVFRPTLPNRHAPDSMTDGPGSAIDGTDGRDEMMGTPYDDLIRGHAGDDDLRGGQGHDTIEAGDGNDWVQGDGDYGPGGNDVIYGGAGDDLLAGQGGDDLLYGDEGDDTLLGGEGDDTLFGGAGNDMLSGHDGNDILISTAGSDDLDGGRGDDVLIGHDGPETVWMNGGEGNDTLMPGAHDFASGNEGEDEFVLRHVPEGFPTIADFDAAEDRITLHLDADVARDAQLSLREDQDGTFLLEVNGHTVGRLLQHGGLKVEDVRIVALH